MVGRHVAQDVVGGGTLLPRKVKRHRGNKRPHVGPVHAVREGRDATKLEPLPREERKLQAQQLVVGKPTARLLLRLHRQREVDLPEGARKRHEAARRARPCRQKVRYVAHVRERGGHDPSHPCGRDAIAHRVHRQDARVIARLSLRAHDLAERRLHLLEAVRERHLAGKRDHVALAQLLRYPRLPEERRLDHARAVKQVHLHHLHPRAGALQRHLVHGRDDCRLLAHVRVGDVRHVREVQVAVGNVEEKVAHAPDAEPLNSRAPRARDIAEARDVVCHGAGAGEPLPHTRRCRYAAHLGQLFPTRSRTRPGTGAARRGASRSRGRVGPPRWRRGGSGTHRRPGPRPRGS